MNEAGFFEVRTDPLQPVETLGGQIAQAAPGALLLVHPEVHAESAIRQRNDTWLGDGHPVRNAFDENAVAIAAPKAHLAEHRLTPLFSVLRFRHTDAARGRLMTASRRPCG